MLPVGGWCKRTAVLQSLPASVLRIFNQNTVPLNKSSLITLPVQWGDMDAFKHLNNVAMMRYFESARVSHFQQVIYPKLYTQVDSDNHAPMEVGAMDYHGVGPIVKTIVCNYRAQACFMLWNDNL
jgi:acyl-CoA thioesterase FadM